MRNQLELPSHLVLNQSFLPPGFHKLLHNLHLHTPHTGSSRSKPTLLPVGLLSSRPLVLFN